MSWSNSVRCMVSRRYIVEELLRCEGTAYIFIMYATSILNIRCCGVLNTGGYGDNLI